MSETVFEIRSDDYSTAEIHRIAKVFPVTGKNLEEKRVRVINKLAILALDALKSASPIDTFELRDEHIIRDELANRRNLTATVVIDSGPHFGRKRKKSYPADIIALALDSGYHHKTGTPFTRSQASEPSNLSGISDYDSLSGPTRGWIKEAKKSFKSARSSAIIG